MSSQHRHAGAQGAGAAALSSRVRLVLAAGVLGLLLGVLWGAADVPRYTASAGVLLSGDGGAPASEVELEAAVQLAASERVASRAAGLLGGDVSGADLLSEIAASADPGAGVVTIEAESDSPDFAAAAANGYALALTRVGGKRYELGAEATIPDGPSENRSTLWWGLGGLLAGLAIGGAGVALRDRLRSQGRGPGAVFADESMPVPPVPYVLRLGVPGEVLRREGGRIETDPDEAGHLDELAARLGIGEEDGPRRLAVLDADDDDGALVVASALAIAAGGRGLRAIVVESDLGSPALAALLDLPATPGLAEYLRGDAGPRDVLRSVRVRAGEGSGSSQLTCLPAGEAHGDEVDDERLAALIERLGRVYDLVLVSGTRVGGGAEAATVAELTDGAVLVASAVGDGPAAIRRAVEALGEANIPASVLTRSGSAQSRPQSPL